MQNGLYKAQFKTSGGERERVGTGVVFVQDGKIRGGDSGMFYVGTLSKSGDDLNIQVECKPHVEITREKPLSVFGVDHLHLDLKGKVDGNGAIFTGHAKETPKLTLQAKLTKISD
jgi:hypothetical protein